MTDNLNEKWEDLLWHVRRSTRYHMRRVRFFDLWHTWTNVLGVLFGSATVVTLLGKLGEEWAIFAGLIITFLFTIDLLVGTARMSRLHNDLAKKFIDLEREIELVLQPEEIKLREFRGSILNIEKEEPPILRALNDICQNEMVLAIGYDKKFLIKIPLYKRLLANFISFEAAEI